MQNNTIMKLMNWIKIINSPFKLFKLKWYIGKTAIGVPYFFPRKWVKATPERAYKATLEEIARTENYNKMNPNYARKIKPYEEIYAEKMRYQYPVPIKVGFSSCGLGWKTKWSETDYRHEYNPVLSFVFFGYQIALTVVEPDHTYWETWLYYERNTDKSKSQLERLLQCMDNVKNIWVRYDGDKQIRTNHYNFILKKKYLKYIEKYGK
jgi:hypothetical protein